MKYGARMRTRAAFPIKRFSKYVHIKETIIRYIHKSKELNISFVLHLNGSEKL